MAEIKSGWQIATEWYRVEETERGLAKCNLPTSCVKIPEDIYSNEFAVWLTEQYRLAMAKGVQLGRDSNAIAALVAERDALRAEVERLKNFQREQYASATKAFGIKAPCDRTGDSQ